MWLRIIVFYSNLGAKTKILHTHNILLEKLQHPAHPTLSLTHGAAVYKRLLQLCFY